MKPPLPSRALSENVKVTGAWCNRVVDFLDYLSKHFKGDLKTIAISDTGTISCIAKPRGGGGEEGSMIRVAEIYEYIGTYGEGDESGHVYKAMIYQSYPRDYTDDGKRYELPRGDSSLQLMVIPSILLSETYKQYPIGTSFGVMRVPFVLPDRFFKPPMYDKPPKDGLCNVWLPFEFSFFTGSLVRE